jgi:hypothetical protein
MKMFLEVNTDICPKRQDIRIVEDDEYNFERVAVFKDGNYCWGYTLDELVFLYLTKDWA